MTQERKPEQRLHLNAKEQLAQSLANEAVRRIALEPDPSLVSTNQRDAALDVLRRLMAHSRGVDPTPDR